MLFFERWIFYVLVFFAPFQLRKVIFIWSEKFNEWTSAFFYATDILILILLALWFRRSARYFHWKHFAAGEVALAVFLGWSLLSLTVADNQGLGWYRFLKISELAALYFYVRFSFGRVFEIRPLAFVLILSGLAQSILAVIQVLLQRSVGLFWLGESVLRTNFNGVAVVPLLSGEKFLRAYGFTPHPNLLAFWLFLAIFAFYFWYLYNRRRQRRSDLTVLIYIVLLWAFFLTFSRVIIGLWFLGVVVRLGLVLFNRKCFKLLPPDFLKRFVCLAVITVLTTVLFAAAYWPPLKSRLFISAQEQAVTQRILYNQIAGEVTSRHLWLGEGLGQFVWQLKKNFAGAPSYFFQPVHNIYLLISSEIGLGGLISFLVFIGYRLYNYWYRYRFNTLPAISFFLVFVSLLAMGLFDHFLMTLQQGSLAFWSLLGVLAALSRPGVEKIDDQFV